MAKKTWLQKYESGKVEVKICDVDFADIRQGEKMLISTPKEIGAVVSAIPAGKIITTGALRAKLAQLHDADKTCPLTTGIFLNVMANAMEDMRQTNKQIAPWWRVVKDDGKLNPKSPGGVSAQAKLLSLEGIEIMEGKGKDNLKVKSIEYYQTAL